MDFSFKVNKNLKKNAIARLFCKSMCLCKSSSRSAENKRKKTINTAFASQQVPLKNRVSDFWQVGLFFFNEQIKLGKTNHQHFLWTNRDYSKTKKENKNRRHGFGGKPSDKQLAKFQPNRSRGCRLGAKNVRSIYRNLLSEKNSKVYFRRRPTRKGITTPKRQSWWTPEGIILL